MDIDARAWKILGLLLGLALLIPLATLIPESKAIVGVVTYLPMHTVVELLSVVVAGTIVAVGWFTLRAESPGNVAVLAASFLAVAGIDTLHLLSFSGMPALVSPSGTEKAIFFWIAARLVCAIGLLWAAFYPWRPMQRRRTKALLMGLAFASILLVTWVGLWHLDWVPRLFVPGEGLTPFKRGLEYALMLLYVVAAWGYWRRRHEGQANFDALSLFAASSILALSEFCLANYQDVTDAFNALGHLYKVIAYGFLFVGIFVTSVRLPYHRLDASQRRLTEANASLEKAVAQLKEADRMKDEFLSVISHELRTPLNFISGFTSIVADEVAGPLTQAQHEYLAKVMVGTERMLGLVDNLLDAGRMSAGRFAIMPAPTSYAAVVEEAVSVLSPLASEKQVRLSVVPFPDVTLSLDRARLIQVLTNLLDNALKFTPPGGSIELRAFAYGDTWVTEIHDSGPGIAKEDLPRLFQRFGQLDMSSTRAVGGTGLGLFISKGIAEAHGGRISASSEGEGKGATFRFTLPLSAKPGRPAGPD